MRRYLAVLAMVGALVCSLAVLAVGVLQIPTSTPGLSFFYSPLALVLAVLQMILLRRLAREWKAIEAIKNLGGRITGNRYAGVASVNLGGTEVTDAGLKELAA